MIKYNTLGFLQQYQNPLIDCIQYLKNGYCDIYFTDGRKVRHFINCETVYNRQFGIPLSSDGKFVYVSSWEKGLTYVAEGSITSEEYMQKLEGFVSRMTNGVKGLNNQNSIVGLFMESAKNYK